jgi:hypothetical protein
MVNFVRKFNDSTQNKEECAGIKEELRKEFSKLEEVIISSSFYYSK